MAYMIQDHCINCSTCADNCPVGCISQGDSIHEINGDECIDCGTCASVCPVDAPQPE